MAPSGADNYLYSTFYYHGKLAFNMKGFQIGKASYDVVSLKCNPAGSAYALLSQKKGKGTVEILDLWNEGKVIHSFNDILQPTAICYSADSRHFFIADAAQKVRVYDTRQYAPSRQLSLPFSAEALETSPNGYFLAISNRSQVLVINQETGNVRAQLSAEGTVCDMAFSEDSGLFGIVTREGVLSVYDTNTFQLQNTLTLPGQHAAGMDFHPDGKYVAVLTKGNEIVFVNLSNTAEQSILSDEDGGLTFLRFLRDGKRNIYLSYNTGSSLKYRQLKGLSPNLTRLLTDELNARMNEWAKMRPDETLEEYQQRVNDESRLQQARLFEQEIATELAGDLILTSEITLGSYNMETGMLTLDFDNMPQIYLTVPENEVSSFRNPANLQFRDVVYGLTKDDKFEITYAIIYNKATGKTYEFNNLERQSLDFLKNNDSFVPIELVQQSSLEEVKLQAIKDDVVSAAKKNNLISDHTNIQVSSNVVSDVDADGKRITNYQVNFNYTVEGKYSVKEDFAAGKYKIEESHAAVSMLNIITRAFEQDFAPYMKPGKKVVIRITGSADALRINGTIAYDGCYGDFTDEPYYLDGSLNSLTVTRQSGIRKNEQLAFMRAMGVKDYVCRHVGSLQNMLTDYQYRVELAEGTGGEFRRISIEFVFVDAFDN